MEEISIDKYTGMSWCKKHVNSSNTTIGISYRYPYNYTIHLLLDAYKEAKKDLPSLQNKSITPHVFRHSTAMGLLQSGVDISTIAIWLGHETIETTHKYMVAAIIDRLIHNSVIKSFKGQSYRLLSRQQRNVK